MNVQVVEFCNIWLTIGHWVKFGHFVKLQQCSVMSNGHADSTILAMSQILEDAIVILLLLL